MIILSSDWNEYELLDSGSGKRLERFGKCLLSRPDPQCIWKPGLDHKEWGRVDAAYDLLTGKDKGEWIRKSNLPDKWLMTFKDIKLWAKLTPFKHTGVFPEQSAHWEWIEEIIRKQDSRSKNGNMQLNVLNLFAYTGAATLICASAGARVTHVDASRPTISWARENQAVSGLTDKPVRWILDDAIKFVQREAKRGVKYDGIIMDPPIYGHGPTGERWDFYDDFPRLLELCAQVLSPTPSFILINAYAISASSIMLENLLSDLNFLGTIESGELLIKQKGVERYLSTGIFARWSAE